MKILIMRVTLRASWVHSLKEKRMVIKSLMQRLRNKFNISVGEVDEQDIHQNTSSSFSILNTDAEIIKIENEEDVF